MKIDWKRHLRTMGYMLIYVAAVLLLFAVIKLIVFLFTPIGLLVAILLLALGLIYWLTYGTVASR